LPGPEEERAGGRRSPGVLARGYHARIVRWRREVLHVGFDRLGLFLGGTHCGPGVEVLARGLAASDWGRRLWGFSPAQRARVPKVAATGVEVGRRLDAGRSGCCRCALMARHSAVKLTVFDYKKSCGLLLAAGAGCTDALTQFPHQPATCLFSPRISIVCRSIATRAFRGSAILQNSRSAQIEMRGAHSLVLPRNRLR